MGAALDAELKSNKKHINDNIMDVSPQNENIDSLFSNTTFYIDFPVNIQIKLDLIILV